MYSKIRNRGITDKSYTTALHEFIVDRIIFVLWLDKNEAIDWNELYILSDVT